VVVQRRLPLARSAGALTFGFPLPHLEAGARVEPRKGRVPNGNMKRILVVLVLVAMTARSHADVYGDANAIIQQLVEDSLSKDVVPNAAAKVPALCSYFPSSISAIQQQRYTGLETVLRKEVADFVGYKAYLELAAVQTGTHQIAAAAVPGLRARVMAKRPQVSGVEATTSITAVITPDSQPEITDDSKTSCSPSSDEGSAQFADKTSIATIQMNACASTQPTPDEETSCAAAITIRDALDGDNSMLGADLDRVEKALEQKFEDLFQKAKGDAALANALKALANNLPAVNGTDLTQTTGQIATIESALKAIRARVGMQSSLSVESVINVVVALGQVFNGDPLLAKLSTWVASAGVAPTDIEAIVADLQRHDYGAVAGAVVDLAEGLACKADCKDDGKVVRAFIRSLAVYIMDLVTSSSSAATAEAGFKNAAIALIEQEGAGGGYSRRWSKPHRWTNFLKSVGYPQFSLREVYRPGHINADGSVTQEYASIDLLTFRRQIRYAQWSYFAVQVKLVDALGPFFDISTGGHLFDNDPNRVRAFFEGFFVPRAELEFGVPALSRNLLVGVGLAFRLYREAPVDGGASPAAAFCFYDKTCAADGQSALTTNYLEVGISITYVP
jgi:hypothetical protein